MCVDSDICSCVNEMEDVLGASLPRVLSLFSFHLITIIFITAGVLWSSLFSPHLSVGHLKIEQLTVVSHILKCQENDRFNEKGVRKGERDRDWKGAKKSAKKEGGQRKRKEEDPVRKKRIGK